MPVAGAVKVCRPEAEKVAGSSSVQRASPGLLLLSSFSVTVSSLPAVEVSAMELKLMPMEVRM